MQTNQVAPGTGQAIAERLNKTAATTAQEPVDTSPDGVVMTEAEARELPLMNAHGPLDRAASEALDKQLRAADTAVGVAYGELFTLMQRALDGQIWKHLTDSNGQPFGNVILYFNDAVRFAPTNTAERQMMVEAMSEKGFSLNTIAQVLDIDKSTASRDRAAGVAKRNPCEQNVKSKGPDGKEYTRTKPKPKPKPVAPEQNQPTVGEPDDDEFTQAVLTMHRIFSKESLPNAPGSVKETLRRLLVGWLANLVEFLPEPEPEPRDMTDTINAVYAKWQSLYEPMHWDKASREAHEGEPRADTYARIKSSQGALLPESAQVQLVHALATSLEHIFDNLHLFSADNLNEVTCLTMHVDDVVGGAVCDRETYDEHGDEDE